eukprot:CAMPEP_0204864364 /NCGR_PEP_ID=MMETSP1348-20121228/4011_1 /ASSEMBLY_ACC=CAM_ASM_000700 /TAXON_ID=215587 /ORGANISM="Aplanochytrium stocchinoi, Strain GSBS06" /LENGTH=359 /DNA_ID=CAMNT_0052014981 /DNA_START=37 /DNA_END=1116 /DNA_ORIENTATION=-
MVKSTGYEQVRSDQSQSPAKKKKNVDHYDPEDVESQNIVSSGKAVTGKLKSMYVSSSVDPKRPKNQWKRRGMALLAFVIVTCLIALVIALDENGQDQTTDFDANENPDDIDNNDNSNPNNNMDQPVLKGAEKFTTPTPRVGYPAWDKLHNTFIAEIQESESIDLLMLGDSVTESFRETRMGQGLDQLIGGKEVFDRGFQKFDKKLAFGITGDESHQLLWRIINGEIPEEGVVIKNVLVYIGINSVYRKGSPMDILAGILQVIKVLESMPAIENVYVLPLLPGTASVYKTIKKINNGLKSAKFLRTTTRVIDCGWDVFRDQTRVGTVTAIKSLMPDQVHPNTAGLLHWSQCISKEIERFN